MRELGRQLVVLAYGLPTVVVVGNGWWVDGYQAGGLAGWWWWWVLVVVEAPYFPYAHNSTKHHSTNDGNDTDEIHSHPTVRARLQQREPTHPLPPAVIPCKPHITAQHGTLHYTTPSHLASQTSQTSQTFSACAHINISQFSNVRA